DWDTGAALGVGRTAYRPPKALRRYLAHRDGGCRFPGCTRPAHACEPDHTTEWQDGGTTDPRNLALLCRKHHALKSIGAWTYHHPPDSHHQPDSHLPPDGHRQPEAEESSGGATPPGHLNPSGRSKAPGSLEWTSPLGRTYISEPADRPADAKDPGAHTCVPESPGTEAGSSACDDFRPAWDGFRSAPPDNRSIAPSESPSGSEPATQRPRQGEPPPF
ncbi:HNH endonuclease signature motif containing protein, partial [Sinomonas humi]|uniref:HNH endonuclease signature motif containing protein n=1 Tax=Sinomonas humi TaxID=1338436 RepID=UPI0005BDD293